MNNPAATAVQSKAEKKTIKCVVWDLDNTLWNGVLLENDDISLRDSVVNVIETLDSRGILQSIASRNEVTTAMQKLREFGLHEYFLYPQINWVPCEFGQPAALVPPSPGLDL